MQSIASLAPIAAQQSAEPDQPQGVSPSVKNLFLLLQGSYGSQFLSKFATGVMSPDGTRDLGVRAAMAVWDKALGHFPADVLEAAASRVRQEHKEFPPNLAQVEALCEACMPRKTYAEENNLPRLKAPVSAPLEPVDYQTKGDGKDWARRILGRAKAGDSIRAYALSSARQALGLEGRQTWQ